VYKYVPYAALASLAACAYELNKLVEFRSIQGSESSNERMGLEFLLKNNE
jgi:hypothetical protein